MPHRYDDPNPLRYEDMTGADRADLGRSSGEVANLLSLAEEWMKHAPEPTREALAFIVAAVRELNDRVRSHSHSSNY